jgi:hypothetical protein
MSTVSDKKRIDRRVGDDALGKSLWSPQIDDGGAKAYSNMENVKVGDIVLHFTDKKGVSGVSRVVGELDTSFKCLDGTKWAGRDGFRIQLGDFITLDELITRDEIFSNKDILLDILNKNTKLFYHRKFALNQKAYLTNLPIELVKLFEEIYFKKTNQHIPFVELDELPNYDIKLESNNIYISDLFISDFDLRNMAAVLKRKKNLILQGPPGVGKSFISKKIAYTLLGGEFDNRIQSIQFHQSFSYEDFIQGYRPKRESSGFYLKNGVFFDFCTTASNDLGNDYIFIIDEINRGNLSKIFGEVMLLIESDKRSNAIQRKWEVSLTYADKNDPKFSIPENVYVLGMMNTADRSLAVVDYALRRRFSFINIDPAFHSDNFYAYLIDKNVSEDIIDLIISNMDYLNQEIENSSDLGAGFKIGHSYFVPSYEVSDPKDWYEDIIKNEIIPLLREYWFDMKKNDFEIMINKLMIE